MSIDFSVRGKHVLITGGTGGIGAAFAEAFTEAGANVTIVDIAPPRANQNSGLKYEHVDMCDDAAVAALGARTERMDVIIHCAGRAALDQEYTPIVFNQIVNLHLTGALRLANAFRPHLKASRGCIIQIASMTSYFAAPYAPAYGAAKTGIMSLTRTLAVEFAGDGIRVNAIAPGWIDTPLTKVVQEQMPEMNRRIVERLPSGRWNTPDELAGRRHSHRRDHRGRRRLLDHLSLAVEQHQSNGNRRGRRPEDAAHRQPRRPRRGRIRHGHALRDDRRREPARQRGCPGR